MVNRCPKLGTLSKLEWLVCINNLIIIQGKDKSFKPPPQKSAKLVDTGGGFFIDEQQQDEENKKKENIKFVEGPGM